MRGSKIATLVQVKSGTVTVDAPTLQSLKGLAVYDILPPELRAELPLQRFWALAPEEA